MEVYFPLAEQFTTQALPSFCGLASLAMVLNALQVDPKRVWQGSWRRAAGPLDGRAGLLPNRPTTDRDNASDQLNSLARLPASSAGGSTSICLTAASP